ncbi:MAG: outer membrane beta-barrel protein, partial [Bacteroidota bacterium]
VRQKFNLTLGTSYQMTRLRGDLISKNAIIDRTFKNMLPVARMNYDFSTFKHLRLDYETSMREPSIQQLQPVIDNTDPLNISVGNPELKPSYSHNVNLNFTTFDPAKFMNFFAFIAATYQTNAITTSQTVDERLVRTSKPVNVSDNLNVNSNVNFGFPVKAIKSRFNIGPNATYSRAVNVLNDRESMVYQKTYGGNVRYNFNYNDVFNLDLSATVRDQRSEFEAAPQQNQEFINQTYSAETSITIIKKYQFNTSYDYYRYDSKTTSFSQSIPILNLWLSRFVMKGNAGELKVGVSNLLNRNLGVTQTATANYLQQERINNLGRYFMVSFTYALNRQLNPFGGGGGGGRRGGGMRMMMMRTDQ